MATIKGLYDCIDNCNGGIRIQAVRYGRGWYCLVAVIEVEDEVWIMFDDLVGGDNDYFSARDFFKKECDGNYVLCEGETPEVAMKVATKLAASLLEGYER